MKFKIIMSIILVVAGCSLKKLPTSLNDNTGKQTAYESSYPFVSDIQTASWFYGVSSSRSRFADIDNTQSGIQDRILVTFNEPVTIKGNDIHLTAVDGRKSGNVNISWTYDSNLMRLSIEILDTILDSTTYELSIAQSAISDLSGNPFDGNNNGKDDGSLDKYTQIFRGPRPNAPLPDRTLPYVSLVVFDSTLSGDVYSDDSLYITFGDNDIDISTVQNGVALFSYPVINDYTANVHWAHSDTTFWGNTRAVFYLSGLTAGQSYMLLIKNSIADTAGNLLDGNNNGIVEADDNDTVFFSVARGDTEVVRYPTLTSYNRSGKIINVYFNRQMDISTLSAENIKCFDNTGAAVSVDIDALPDTTGVIVTMKDYEGTGVLYLSENIRSYEGFQFDGNRNGIGGEPGLDEVFLSF